MRVLMIASLLFFSTEGEAQEWTPGLKGSKASLRRQNERADKEGLERISNDRRLLQLQRQGYLVPIRETLYLVEKNDSRWHPKYRWLRPNAATFLDDLAAVYYSWFGVSLQVNSAVRTKVRQRRIIRAGNYNAAPINGERASPHLTGAALDIAKLPLTAEQCTFLRIHLKDLEVRGFIEVSEEFNQAVFHIMVFNTYPARDPVFVASLTPQ